MVVIKVVGCCSAGEVRLAVQAALGRRTRRVQALAGASLTIEAGETMALVGDNGAGKSTFVKALSGVQPPDAGEIRLRGEPVSITSPREAGRLGIEVVYQDLALADSIDVPGNVFLGDEPVRLRLGWFSVPDDRRMAVETERTLERLRIRIPNPRRPVGTLSGGQRQAVAIGRAIRKSEITLLVLDEPTAALGVEEVRKVLDLIRSLKAAGQTMLVISHDLEHVFQVSDRIAVIRSGRILEVRRTATSTKTDIVRLIVGDLDAAA
jgi:simple sugar transport system ATP-binding protein